MNRRLVVVVSLMAIGLASFEASAARITGRVFLDQNRNGVADPGDPGVAECLVSDGRRLTPTDQEGKYCLDDVARGTTVFVVNPKDTWPVGPWWVHVADEDDSRVVDFALESQQQAEPLYFVHGTDIHLRSGAVSMYEAYVEHVNQLAAPVQFVVHTGDLVVDTLRSTPADAEKLFALYMQTSLPLRVPRRDVIGNHEHVGLGRSDVSPDSPDFSKGLYRKDLGPTSYAFRWGRYHFVVLDGTTVDSTAGMGYRDGLDVASADWAVEYLKALREGEPVVLMIHQPLGRGDTVSRLSEALRGKRLLATLWGHGHGRSVGKFGGSPAVMGGAVSYAWHGFVPYPPDPRGYVLFRLEGDTVDYVFLDWAHKRSIEVLRPSWEKPVSGEVAFEVTVSDPDASLKGLSCKLSDREFSGELLSATKLVRRYRLTVETAHVADGVYDLTFATRDENAQEEQSRPVIVVNGKRDSWRATQDAVLTAEVRGSRHDGGEFLLNGRRVGAMPVSNDAWHKVSLPLKAASLVRLNEIVVRSADGDEIEVRRLALTLSGRTCRDVRFAAGRSLRPVATPDGKRRELTLYVDAAYQGPRGR